MNIVLRVTVASGRVDRQRVEWGCFSRLGVGRAGFCLPLLAPLLVELWRGVERPGEPLMLSTFTHI